ncbi:FkbM family methyltransferase [Azospirillum sp. TSH100]|uniref:FkbM family methyltransferase n=1 Tax=Azospirillum sp. TSH100 TaxID=652764 RepID=UPI0013048560|nr:FkbM family methyltransferase [Azospirillum sp. TSH100]
MLTVKGLEGNLFKSLSLRNIGVDQICQHSFFKTLNKDSIVVDFGANGGAFSHAIIKRYGCRVFSAEPVPELVRKIDQHPSLTLQPVAISGMNGTMRINIYPDRCPSAFDRYEREGLVEAIDVETVTLEEFRRRCGIEAVDLLKVDIEGSELDMFLSVRREELSDIMQISVEFHSFIYPDTLEKVRIVKNRMRKIGFRVIDFSLNNTDVLFVNRRASVGVSHIFWAATVLKYCRGIRRRLRRLVGQSA